MSTAHSSLARPAVFADAERGITAFLSGIARMIEDRRTFRSTLRDLRALSIRQRDDLGIAGLDMKAVAREAMQSR